MSASFFGRFGFACLGLLCFGVIERSGFFEFRFDAGDVGLKLLEPLLQVLVLVSSITSFD